jgi:N-acetylmuramoyl-L-alanine amidase
MSNPYKVFINAGHGGIDPGTSRPNGTHEKDDNLLYAKAIRNALVKKGIECVMAREGDENQDPVERNILAGECAIAIDCHRNYYGGESATATGAEVWIHSEASEAIELWARNIVDCVESAGFNLRPYPVCKGVPPDKTAQDPEYIDFWVNKLGVDYSMLIELGFMDNETDNAIFDAHYEEIAQAIAKVIFDKLVEMATAPGGPFDNPSTGGGSMPAITQTIAPMLVAAGYSAENVETLQGVAQTVANALDDTTRQAMEAGVANAAWGAGVALPYLAKGVRSVVTVAKETFNAVVAKANSLFTGSETVTETTNIGITEIRLVPHEGSPNLSEYTKIVPVVETMADERFIGYTKIERYTDHYFPFNHTYMFDLIYINNVRINIQIDSKITTANILILAINGYRKATTIISEFSDVYYRLGRRTNGIMFIGVAGIYNGNVVEITTDIDNVTIKTATVNPGYVPTTPEVEIAIPRETATLGAAALPDVIPNYDGVSTAKSEHNSGNGNGGTGNPGEPPVDPEDPPEEPPIDETTDSERYNQILDQMLAQTGNIAVIARGLGDMLGVLNGMIESLREYSPE